MPTASFVAIDEEMTGISVGQNGPPRKDLLPTERYSELKQAPEKFNIIQLGVSVFTRNEVVQKPEQTARVGRGYAGVVNVPDSKLYSSRRFNIYLFPAPANRHEVERDIVMSPSTVSFLHKHNMSFDMWTKEGVPFVNSVKAKDLLKRFEERHQQGYSNSKSSGKRIELRSSQDVTFHARAMASVREWLDNVQEQPDRSSGPTAEDEDGALPEEGISFLLPPCNSFLRRVLYESIQDEYPSLVVETTPENCLRVIRLSPDEKAKRETRMKKDAWESLIRDKLGAFRVFDALRRACNGEPIDPTSVMFASSFDQVDWNKQGPEVAVPHRKVPIVAHHAFMDLCFLMTHFHAPRLPTTLQNCKALIRRHFPIIYDTKVLATESLFVSESRDSRRTSVAELFESLVLQPIDSEEPLVNNIHVHTMDKGDQQHEAAYDAFMTGAIFASMLEKIQRQALPNAVGVMSMDWSPQARLFLHRNLIYQMSVFTIDLEQMDSYKEPMCIGLTTSRTFMLSGAGCPGKTRDITQALLDLSDPEGRAVNYEIMWVSDNEVLVGYNAHSLMSAGVMDDAIPDEHSRILRKALTRSFPRATTTDFRDLIGKRAMMNQLQTYWRDGFSSFLDPRSWFKRSAPDHEGGREAKRQRV